MAEAVGLAFVDIATFKKLPKALEDAPERFMIAMADAAGEGMHYFMSREAAEQFACAMIKTVCDGNG